MIINHHHHHHLLISLPHCLTKHQNSSIVDKTVQTILPTHSINNINSSLNTSSISHIKTNNTDVADSLQLSSSLFLVLITPSNNLQSPDTVSWRRGNSIITFIPRSAQWTARLNPKPESQPVMKIVLSLTGIFLVWDNILVRRMIMNTAMKDNNNHILESTTATEVKVETIQ